MLLITLSYVWKPGNLVCIPVGGRGGQIVEQWLYSGGLKRFLYNINKKQKELFPVVLNVEELGKVDTDELQNMIRDGYKFMAAEENFDTLYKE